MNHQTTTTGLPREGQVGRLLVVLEVLGREEHGLSLLVRRGFGPDPGEDFVAGVENKDVVRVEFVEGLGGATGSWVLMNDGIIWCREGGGVGRRGVGVSGSYRRRAFADLGELECPGLIREAPKRLFARHFPLGVAAHVGGDGLFAA